MKRNLRTAFIATSLFIGALGFSSQTSAQAPPAPAAPSPQVPSSIQPDDLSELQNCYNALHDPQMCQLLVAEQAKWDVRFFELKYANPNSVYQALGIFRARVNVSQNLRLISVKAPKEIMPAIEDAIKRLDVPPAPRKSVELTLF